MKIKYEVTRHKFLKGKELTLPEGWRIVEVIDKLYESDGMILVLLIEHP